MFYLKNAEIIPGKSIGVFKLGMSFDDIKRITKDFEVDERETCDVLICGDISFWVDREKDSCYQILVENDFQGRYDNKIGLGMTLSEINALGLEWYEDLDAYFIKDVSGICFELADAENEDDEWDELTTPITYITVYKD